eukprot:9354631-Lingulodinium_polyedra.AAC.1
MSVLSAKKPQPPEEEAAPSSALRTPSSLSSSLSWMAPRTRRGGLGGGDAGAGVAAGVAGASAPGDGSTTTTLLATEAAP